MEIDICTYHFGGSESFDRKVNKWKRDKISHWDLTGPTWEVDVADAAAVRVLLSPSSRVLNPACWLVRADPECILWQFKWVILGMRCSRCSSRLYWSDEAATSWLPLSLSSQRSPRQQPMNPWREECCVRNTSIYRSRRHFCVSVYERSKDGGGMVKTTLGCVYVRGVWVFVSLHEILTRVKAHVWMIVRTKKLLAFPCRR